MATALFETETLVVQLTDVRRNTNQVRKTFDSKKLEELASDIKINGMINPMIVRRLTNGAKQPFELVAGERRHRAAEIAKIETVLVRVIPADKTDRDLAVIELIDNISREDLTTYETAAGFARLVETHKMSGNEVARAVGRNVSYVNRLLKPYSQLHPKIKQAWSENHEMATVVTLGKIVSQFEDGTEQLSAWKNFCEFGTFEAPEPDDSTDTEVDSEGEKDEKDKASFRVKPGQCLERFNIVNKSLNDGNKYDGAWVRAAIRYMVGKRAMPPEGIELPERLNTTKKKAPLKVRDKGTV